MNNFNHEQVAKHYNDHPYPTYPWYFWGRWKDMGAIDLKSWPIDGSVEKAWLCGAGTIQPLLFARRNPRVRFLATDLSDKSLFIAKSRCRLFGAHNVEFQVEDLTQSNRSGFDAVDAYGVVHHTLDPKAAVRVLVNALRVGGVLRLMIYSNRARSQIEEMRKEIMLEDRGWSDRALKDFLRRKNISLTGDLANRAGRADALIHPLVHIFSESQVEDLYQGLPVKVMEHRTIGNHILFLKKVS